MRSTLKRLPLISEFCRELMHLLWRGSKNWGIVSRVDFRDTLGAVAASRIGRLILSLVSAWAISAAECAQAQDITGQLPGILPGLGYTNYFLSDEPWSIHVISMDRKDPTLSLHSFHSRGLAIGMATLTDQIRRVNPEIGQPIAAINGDFYQRERAFAGDPRGIQIIEGELVSGPNDRATMWVDTNGQPNLAVVTSRFAVTWPEGSVGTFDLNGERAPDGTELYTPALGGTTRTQGGHEVILEKGPDGPWLPLKIGQSYSARVREVREEGNAEIAPGTMVLSLGPAARFPASVIPGSIVNLNLATLPSLLGARVAISGGPTLLRGGKRQRVAPKSESYESTSMLERHPRTAIGWNKTTFYFVEVDGRQKGLSVGMTLDEVATLLSKLGCEDGMNLDGGGSSTLWAAGRVRNKPCDGHERMIANSLMILRSEK